MTATLPPVTDTIIALLGGKQVITSQVRNNLDLVQAAQAGVPVAAVRHLQKHLRFTNREMSEALSISESTLARREQAHGTLTRDEGEKAIQLSALVAHGLEVFEDEGDFNHWLHTTNVALGGIQPYSLLASALGREQVRMLLFRIQHGIYS